MQGIKDATVAYAFMFVFVLLDSIASGNPVAFTKGDASFTGIVFNDSSFLKGDDVVHAASLFCCGQDLDYTKGSELDVSNAPRSQLAVVRRMIAELFRKSKHQAVLLCVTDTNFDFEKNWLGIPYNRAEFRLAKTDWVTNCFGPTGSSSISLRDAINVPELIVESVSDERYKLTGNCCFCIITIDNAVFQAVRQVIDSLGDTRTVQFNYKPQARVCFEEGDSFFIAKATPLFESTEDSVELRYLVSPRRSYRFYGKNADSSLALSAGETGESTSELPISTTGSLIRLSNIRKGLKEKLGGNKEGQVWYVFVVAPSYDPLKSTLGVRYNNLELKSKKRPLPFEFIDCNECIATYPSSVAAGDPIWPEPLPVEWQGDVVSADADSLQFILFQWWDNTPFHVSSVIADHFRWKGDIVEHWVKGAIAHQHSLKRN